MTKKDDENRPVDPVPIFRMQEASEQEARQIFPKDYAGEELVPMIEQIQPGHTVFTNAPRSYVLTATAILKRKKPGMRFKVKSDQNGRTWIFRSK